MARFLRAILTGSAMLVGTSAIAQQPTSPPNAGSPPVWRAADDGYLIGKPVRHKNLTIVPVSTQRPHYEDRFITLDEGLKAGTVRVLELGVGQAGSPAPERYPSEPGQSNPARGISPPGVGPSQPPSPPWQASGGGAQVNKLQVSNGSDKPLYLMPGEIVSGGQQDRTIGGDLVIQPGKDPVPINVFCVEQGRWRHRTAQETVALLSPVVQQGGVVVNQRSGGGSGGRTVDESLQASVKNAEAAEFLAGVGQVSRDVRMVVQTDKDQGVVWKKVTETSMRTGANAASTNFTANYAQPAVVQRLQSYLESCRQPVLDQPQVIGVVVAINGQIQSAELFESTPLFKKFWNKLLRSYALDAALVADQRDGELEHPVEACREFLKLTIASPVAKVEVQGKLHVTRRESGKVVSFFVGEAQPMPARGAGAGRGPIHFNAYSKEPLKP